MGLNFWYKHSFLLSKWNFDFFLLLFSITEVVFTVFLCKTLGLGDKRREMNWEKKLEIRNTSMVRYENVRFPKAVKMCFEDLSPCSEEQRCLLTVLPLSLTCVMCGSYGRAQRAATAWISQSSTRLEIWCRTY